MAEAKTNRIIIRRAKPYDASNICRMLERSHYEESLYPPPDEGMVLRWVTQVLTEGFVLVAERSGRLTGSVAVTNYQFPWSPKWYLSTDWLYVVKEARDGGTFSALMTALHRYADSMKAPIFGGVQSGVDAKLKDRLMAMKGYQYIGGQFIRKEADDGVQEDQEHQHL
jgi:predicted N-acetyltransferase YhbS